MSYFMRDGQKWHAKRVDGITHETRCHHLTPGEAPAGVRRESVDGWFSAVRALKAMKPHRRWDRLRLGVPLKVGTTPYVVKAVWEGPFIGTGEEPVIKIGVGKEPELWRRLNGAISMNGVPVTYLDDFQEAADELLIEEIMGL